MLALISTCFFVTQLIVDFLCAGIVDKLGYRVCIIAAEVTSGLDSVCGSRKDRWILLQRNGPACLQGIQRA